MDGHEYIIEANVSVFLNNKDQVSPIANYFLGKPRLRDLFLSLTNMTRANDCNALSK